MRLLICGWATLQVFAAPAVANWTAIRLHPEGALHSSVNAVTATRQGGIFTTPSPSSQTGFWSGSAGAWTPLADSSGALYGMDETRQVGRYIGAALWYGTPESRVDLHPHSSGMSDSEALAVAGDMQVGFTRLPGPGAFNHAALWRGTAASWVDLHPAGAERSFANATDGVRQAGEVRWPEPNGRHAALWNGTAESFVDLNPPGATISAIYGMAAGVQAGYARPVGVLNQHAAVWSGTAESWVDLHPPGPGGASIFYATTGSVHVGVLSNTGLARAAINFGTPDSWLSLHQFLPPGYSTFSTATSVYQDGDTIYVGGWAFQDQNLPQHAFLWVGTIPAPGAGVLLLAAGFIAARRRR